MNFKDYLQKLQALPDKQKKIVLWTIVAILAIVMGYFWIRSAAKRLEDLGKSVKIPQIEMPQTELPDILPATDQTAEPKNNITPELE